MIQYYKNATLADGQGHSVTMPPGPSDQPWKWTAGGDGFIVDRAKGDQRCWPGKDANHAYGVDPDQAAKTVKWSDNPGIGLGSIAGLVRATPALVFPLTYSADFKTDILCTEGKVCSAEKDVTAEQRARWTSTVRGSVDWSFKCNYIQAPAAHGGGLLPAVSWNDPPRILNIQKHIYKHC